MPTSILTLHIFDGTRQLFPSGTKVLVTVTDGNQKRIIREYFNAAEITVMGLPFYDNAGDQYAVLAFVEGYRQAGYAPVKLSPVAATEVDIMLVPKEPVFNFAALTWDVAKRSMPFLGPIDGRSDPDAKEQFSEMLEKAPKSLASMMNLATVMKSIDLGGKTPADFIKQVRWDFKPPAQDRFFAYCDEALIDAVREAASKGQFDAEQGCGLMHCGASVSWKQNALSEANLQLTFHNDPIDCVPANRWVTVEPDIDYYKDLAAHSLLEVCRNQLTGSLTEPADVFVLRWIEHRLLGLPEFNPGYTLRSN